MHLDSNSSVLLALAIIFIVYKQALLSLSFILLSRSLGSLTHPPKVLRLHAVLCMAYGRILDGFQVNGIWGAVNRDRMAIQRGQMAWYRCRYSCKRADTVYGVLSTLLTT